MPSKSKESNTKFLKDHQRKGKRFIPPILQLANIQEVKWIDHILPEIVWLGLLNAYYGLKNGAHISLSLSKAAKSTYSGGNTRLFAAVSSYSLLDSDQCIEVVSILEKSNQLKELQKALYPLYIFYPECPLNFVFQRKLFKSTSNDSGLVRFKKVLASLFDRRGKQATLMQANLINIAFCTHVFDPPKGSLILRFPAVVDYPNNEESRLIASSIRSSVNMFFGASINEFEMIPSTSWPAYFWNRGLVIERCKLD